MITLCTVTLDTLNQYEKVLIESILQHCTMINEVIFADNSKNPDFYDEWEEGKIIFRRIGAQTTTTVLAGGDQHALGLHTGIDAANNDLIYLCDPDIFFINNVDEFFYNLKNKYALDAIGCSHHSATELSSTFFPWHGAILMNRTKLPTIPSWLNPKYPGKWLMAGLGTDEKELYPNPSGTFDTASALWLWAHLQNWKWLSFQTQDAHLYTTKFFRSNIKISEHFPLKKLIYHAVSGSITPSVWGTYKMIYEWHKETE